MADPKPFMPRLDKDLGQHLLIDNKILDQLVATIAPDPAETLVEVGPGTGVLTERLLPRVGHLCGVEFDRRMVGFLRRRFPDALECGHLDLWEGDALRYPWEARPEPRYVVVGNLPYNITSALVFRLVGELGVVDHPLRQRVSRMIFMVQREVAERMTAKPSTPGYGALTLTLQVWAEAELAFIVPPKAFRPPPKVQSAVVVLRPRPEPLVDPVLLPRLHRLIRASFALKRKTLRNALKASGLVSVEGLDTLLDAAAIPPQVRAEALPLEAFVRMAALLPERPPSDASSQDPG